MIKKFIVALILVFFIACNKENTTVKIGAPIPNYTFKNIINHPTSSLAIQQLKGKVVILEFWATWCGPCIPAMKKLNTLQQRFKDDLKVIAISSENKKRLQKFIRNTGNQLVITSDTTHQTVFKYKVIPHAIIIDQKGIVRAITNPELITEKVIQDLIDNKEIALQEKNDFYVDPTIKMTTIQAINTTNYRLELKSYDPKKRGGYRLLKDPEGLTNGISMWNSTLPRLYQTLYNIPSPNRIVFRDSLSYQDFPYQKDHQYNLTIEVAPKYYNEWRSMSIDLLNKQFDTNARMVTDSLNCYVLKDIDHSIQPSTATKTQYSFMGTILKTKKIKMKQLVAYIENFTSIPVVDHTQLTGDYDIVLEWNGEAPKTLHTELKKYGLTLEKSKTKLPVKVMEIYKKQLTKK